MKNIIIALGLVISASALVGCEESLDTYAGENGIYFDTRYEESEMQNDTIDVHWGLKKIRCHEPKAHIDSEIVWEYITCRPPIQHTCRD